MKPWEVIETVKQFQKMSRDSSLKMGFALIISKEELERRMERDT